MDAPSEAVVTLTADNFKFELENVPAETANLKLVILASEPQSNGVTRAYAKAAGFIDPFTPVAEEEKDLKADYEAKCGYPTAAAPRVFMKYFFVNTVTGEKSGEMMTAANSSRCMLRPPQGIASLGTRLGMTPDKVRSQSSPRRLR